MSSDMPPATARPRTLYTPLPPVQLENFAGPLDLLLHLVRQGQMDIFDLPIAALCEQYLAYLSAMKAVNLSVAGEFFVMAATLIEIKSRLLLPPVPKPEAEMVDGAEGDSTADPRAELVERLLEYGKFQSIAEGLKVAEGERRSLFFRSPMEYSSAYASPAPFGTLSASDLLKTLSRLLNTVGAGEQAVTSVRRQKVTLRLVMREVQTRAQGAGTAGIALTQLLPAPSYLLREVVLLFLALLELLKSGIVRVIQPQFCADIQVFFVPETERISFATAVEEGA